MQQCPHPPWPCWGQCPSTPGAEGRIWPFPVWEGVGLSLCFPSNAHPSAPSRHLEPSLWPQSYPHSVQPSGMQGPTVPTSPASPAARPPALGTSLPEGPGPPPGRPAASPSSTPPGSPRMQYQPSCSCRTQGAPKLPTLFWESLACMPNYLRPWGWEAVWGSQWQ